MKKTCSERLMEERLFILKLLSGTISILIVLNTVLFVFLLAFAQCRLSRTNLIECQKCQCQK